jgi:hypothetical protein
MGFNPWERHVRRERLANRLIRDATWGKLVKALTARCTHQTQAVLKNRFRPLEKALFERLSFRMLRKMR